MNDSSAGGRRHLKSQAGHRAASSVRTHVLGQKREEFSLGSRCGFTTEAFDDRHGRKNDEPLS
jgi:hypothetical protein